MKHIATSAFPSRRVEGTRSQGGRVLSPLSGGMLLAAAAIVDVHGPAESGKRIADALTVEAHARFAAEQTDSMSDDDATMPEG